MHQPTTASVAAAPVVFLNLPWVLVTDPVQLRLMGMVPMFLKWKLERGDLEGARQLCAELVSEKVRLNLRRLHLEFAPRYVIASPLASRLVTEEMAYLLCFAGLDFVAENLHPDWRNEADSSGTRAGEISRWLAAHPELQAGFVILDSIESAAELPASPLSASTVMCSPARGLTTSALNRARLVLRGAAPTERDAAPQGATHY